jgi:hypothetical protein
MIVVTVDFKGPEVVLLMRVVRVTKIVEHRDRLDDPLDGLGAEGRNAWRHHRDPFGEILTQLIVQRAEARSLLIGPPEL